MPSLLFLEHWDKIVFGTLEHFSTREAGQPQQLIPIEGALSDPNALYDVKVLDDPTKVADLRDKVALFLRVHGYTDTSGGGPTGSDIVIKQVQYSVVCKEL
jgi:hypothetical protein